MRTLYYIDTCILVYAAFRNHNIASKAISFFERVTAGNYQAILSTWALAEFRHVSHHILFDSGSQRFQDSKVRDKTIKKEKFRSFCDDTLLK